MKVIKSDSETADGTPEEEAAYFCYSRTHVVPHFEKATNTHTSNEWQIENPVLITNVGNLPKRDRCMKSQHELIQPSASVTDGEHGELSRRFV